MNRRIFLKNAGFLVLSMQMVSTAKAFFETECDANSLSIKSGPSALFPTTNHFHYLCIPQDVLKNIPQKSVKVKTTWALGHFHEVVLLPEHVQTVASGGTILVRDTARDHQYLIKLAV